MSDTNTRSTAQVAAELKELHAAERRGDPFLVGCDGEGRQLLYVLADDRRVLIGRNPDADISLSWDPEVSRVHAWLEQVGGQWTVVDDGLSRNGTFVEGSRVTGHHRLRNEQSMCFGTTRLKFRDPAEDEVPSTVRVTPSAASATLTHAQRQVLIALCRPVFSNASATPATNRQIAEELNYSVDSVKANLRVLFERFGLGELAQNEKRAQLARRVHQQGVLTARDF